MGKKKALLKYEGTVAGAVADAFGVIEGLAEEMREAYENTPESLQSSGAGEARGEAADALEQISEPDVDGTFGDIPVVFEYRELKRRASRSDRLSEGINIASQAISALQDSEPDEGEDPVADERQTLIDEIQSMIDEAEGVNFPGMYG